MLTLKYVPGHFGGNEQTLHLIFAPLVSTAEKPVISNELSEKAVELLSATCGDDDVEPDSEDDNLADNQPHVSNG